MIDTATLAGFTGTETYHGLGPIAPSMVMTDGALYVAMNGGTSGAMWLMMAIASHQKNLLKNHPWAAYAQFWKLQVNADNSAVLTCVEDSGLPPAVTQDIEYTDFDLPEMEIWIMPTAGPRGERIYVMMLKTEY